MTESYLSKNRNFSESQRKALYIASDGLCPECGDPLPPNFHGDHDIPWRLGGKTTLDNGIAKCPKCNLKKGGKVEFWTPQGVVLRRWQVECAEKFIRKIMQGELSFLAQAQPGAGKTFLAGIIARWMLDRRMVDRILVVSPSVNLREDWADNMRMFGIELDPNSSWKNERTTEYQGKSTTYQTLMKVPGRIGGADVESNAQFQKKTLVTLDECHHPGHSLAWGEGILAACKNAVAILCLSGTPFRLDGNPIPFVKFDDEGKAVPDFVYSYADSLAEIPQVCRAAYFPNYEANTSWTKDDKTYQASFADDVDEEMQSDRLRAVLTSGEWLEGTLQAAHEQLSKIRVVHPDAACLVVAMDKRHAENLAKVLKRITLSDPLVVTSDDETAKDKIKAFRTKTDPWIIAIKMVSEGVDIKRLRVCAYLSNCVSPLFFIQVIGRILRYIPGIPDQSAYFYFPADHRLVELAERFMEERVYGLTKDAQVIPESSSSEEQEEFWDDVIDYNDRIKVISGESWHNSTITYEGDTYSPQELAAAEQFAKQKGYSVSREAMAKIIRDCPSILGDHANGTKIHAEIIPEKPLYEKHEDLKRATRKQEQSWLSELRERWFPNLPIEEGYKRINGGLKKHQGASKENLTLEQKRQRLELLRGAVLSKERPTWIL
jgi:superfamily II DNA or RNA helicase